MQGSWIKKTLSLILTLTLVIGVCGMLPAGALANGGEYQLSPKSTSVDVGGQKTFAVEQADATATPANAPVKYVWSAPGGTLVSGGGETDATATYQFDTAGSASVSCALYASAEPDAAAFETPSASVTVNAPAPASDPAPTTETTTPSGTTPSDSGSGSGSGLLLGASNGTFELTAPTGTASQINGQYIYTKYPPSKVKWTLSRSGVITLGSTTSAQARITVVGVGEVDVIATDAADPTNVATTAITVNPELSISPTDVASMSVDAKQTLKITVFPTTGINIASSDNSVLSVDKTSLSATGSITATAKKIAGSGATVTATVYDSAGDPVTAEFKVAEITGKAPTLSWKNSSITLTQGKSVDLKNYLSYSSGITPKYSIDPDDGSLGTLSGSVLTAVSGGSGVITVTAESDPVSPYKAGGPVTMKVFVGTNSRITASPSTMKLGVNGSDLAAITKTTGTGKWVITSSNSNVADWAFNNTAEDADTGVISVYGYKTGTAVITVRAEGSTSSATIQVTVGTPTSGVKVNFFSSDNKTTTLTRDHAWGTLQVTVANYNPAQPYVTLTRSNIRTYVREGGSYASHPQPNSWVAKLAPNAEDPTTGEATLYIAGQYNGNTTYAASYVYASGVNAVPATSPTIYVTGFAALPQTGPDYTWAYVLGGLCLAAIATAITLNVKRKKKQQDN